MCCHTGVVIEPEDPTYTIQEGSPVQYIDIPIVLRGMKEPGLECNVTVHTEDGSAIGKLLDQALACLPKKSIITSSQV